MGASWSEISTRGTSQARLISQPNALVERSPRETTPTNGRLKRRHSDVSDEDIEELSPKRKKIQTTSKYIYETLFLKGTNHDMIIRALGKKWKLHKVYLCQSAYFSSMFSGNWRETDQTDITLNIPDSNITAESLDIAFSSLYRDKVHLEESQVVPLVAAATMLQLDGLLEHCVEFMKEKMSEHVVSYLTASQQYGLTQLKEECYNWLKLHLVKSHSVTFLKELSVDLLSELLGSSELYVMQVEMDVYTLAKRWLYLTLHSDWTGDMDKLLADSEQYFKEHSASHNGRSFLECERGEPFVSVFRGVRLQHILNDVASVRTIEADKIIPESWLLKLYRSQWLKMLLVDQRMDPGPTGMLADQFKASSIRCGRVLYEAGEYCWRWTGFSFGIDVLIMFNSSTGVVNIKRNTRTQPCVSAVSMQPTRVIMIRLRATSLDGNGGISSTFDSGLYQVPLSYDEEYQILTISNSTFPLYFSVNLALTAANDSSEQHSQSV